MFCGSAAIFGVIAAPVPASKTLLLVILFVLRPAAAPAASIELVSGRVLQAELVGETESHVALRVEQVGTSMAMQLPKSRIHAIREDGVERVLTAKPVINEPARRPVIRQRQSESEEERPEPEDASALASTSMRAMAFRGDYDGCFRTAIPPQPWRTGDRRWLWTLALQGTSNASPVVNGDRIFCCEEPNTLVCADRRSGEELWRASNSLSDAGQGGEPHRPNWIATYGWTSPTPITVDDRVYIACGNGVVAAYDLAGERQWITTVEPGGRFHGTAASPCLIDDVLVVYMAAGSGGRYAGIDVLSGRQRWQCRSAITQGSLVPLAAAGTTWALSSGGVLFDPRTGTIAVDHKTLFGDKNSAAFLGKNWGATVVVDGSVAYFSNHTADTNNTLMVAIDFADPRQPQLLWQTPTGGRIGASHLLHDGLLYLAGGRCLDAATGATLYEGQAGKASYSSLVLFGDVIIQFGKKDATIWHPGRRYREIARFPHGFEDFIASAVAVGPVFYFRDRHGLHCIATR